MNEFDEQTDFSFIGIAVSEPVSLKITKSRTVNIGNQNVSLTITRTFSAESRAKMSANHRGGVPIGFRFTDESRAKMSAKSKGRIQSAEANAKRRATLIGKARPDRYKPMMTPNGIYPSMKAVCLAAKRTDTTIGKWMKKWPQHYYYIETTK